MSITGLPFQYLHLPNFKLVTPNLPRPSPYWFFFLILLTFYVVTSGIIYDLINEPPSMGQRLDARGNRVSEVFVPYRLNAQYIIEGLTSGFVYVLGALALIGLDVFPRLKLGKRGAEAADTGSTLSLISFGVFMASFYILVFFFRMKMPSYSLVNW